MDLIRLAKCLRVLASHYDGDDWTTTKTLMSLGLSEGEAVRLQWFAPYAFAKERIEALGFQCDDFVEIVPDDNKTLSQDEIEKLRFVTINVLQPEYIECVGYLALYPWADDYSIKQDEFTRIVMGSIWVNSASDLMNAGEKPDGHILRAVLHSTKLAEHVVRLDD